MLQKEYHLHYENAVKCQIYLFTEERINIRYNKLLVLKPPSHLFIITKVYK